LRKDSSRLGSGSGAELGGIVGGAIGIATAAATAATAAAAAAVDVSVGEPDAQPRAGCGTLGSGGASSSRRRHCRSTGASGSIASPHAC
jgi:hypothetical protein